ncbi:MAG: TRAP transporter large permease, partial [Pseudomonadota bacterium]
VGFQRIVSGINVFSLMAIPFFIFAGELMFHGGIAIRLVRFAQSAVGAMRGGLGVVNVFSSMLFGGISGSAIADISALGSILIPVMKDKGYDADYAVNVTVTSSIAGIIIPPSHNMIIFALATGGAVSISKLFLAGVVPGVLMCLCLAVTAYIVAVKRGYKAETFPGWTALAYSFAGAIPGLLTAVIIVGGVLSGIFTVTESGAFGAMYAFVVTLLVYRSLTWSGFKTAVVQAVRTTSMVMILIACAAAFAYMLTFYRVPSQMVDLLTGITDDPILILLMINVVLLLLGMIMDMAALILICTPIFLPVANSLGMDPLQFGMMLLVNLGLGLCTPPVGSCLFVGCAVGKLPIETAVRTIWPFYIAIFVALMLITFVPAISLTLPGLLK